ncbi:MAG TPA: hypothetical protein DDW52_25775 [Planctomycetaceae bacterium]|nr:hypothetical protein [Planctomycetaceae bacterium]
MPLVTGCGGGGDEAPTASTSNPQSSSQAEQPNAQAAAPQIEIVQNGASQPAAETVAIFLDSLRRGNEEVANGALTKKAREEVAKSSWVMQPLGTPEGRFEIGRVSYTDPTKEVALVECLWQEPAAEGETAVATDIVCEVRQEPGEGWRISGLAISIPDTEDAIVLDFEDSAALKQTLDAATGTPATPAGQPAQTPGQVAGQLPTQQLPTQQLPPPAQYAPPTQQPAAGNVQTALPPLPGGPIKR